MPNEMNSASITDGFHLVVDALKLNAIDTIFGVAGIPITDLARLAQAEGLRYIGFRHEQSAGNAAAIAGYLTGKPGICAAQVIGALRTAGLVETIPGKSCMGLELPNSRRQLVRLVELLSTNPATIVNLQGRGTLAEGSVGDVTIFDPKKRWTYDVTKTRSRSRNCPYDGMQFYGQVRATIVGGKMVFSEL